MKKLMLIILIMSTLLLCSCSSKKASEEATDDLAEKIKIDLGDEVIEMYEGEITLNHLSSTNGKGYVKFKWRNLDSRMQTWSFNGSGLSIWVEQGGREVGGMEVTSDQVKEKVKYDKEYTYILEFDKIDETKPLTMIISSLATIDDLDTDKEVIIDLESGTHTIKEINK